MRLDAHDKEVDSITKLLEEYGAVSVSFEPNGQADRIERDLNTLPKWESLRLSALFPEDLELATLISNINALDESGDRLVQMDRVKDKDWENSWRQNFAPMDLGNGLWVCPSWCDVPLEAQTIIRLDPGLAFGTGTHATTRLCLQQMGELFVSGQAFDSVLDYGCGSGVLAIAAAKLGAQQVWAVDIDPRALTTTADNAAVNAVTTQLHIDQADELPTEFQAHFVVANILANTLIDLSADIQQRVKPSGRLLLSGLLHDQADSVCQHYANAFAFERHFADEWCLLSGIKQL